MAMSVNIMQGIASSIAETLHEENGGNIDRSMLVSSLQAICSAIDECVEEVRKTKEVPYKSLAQFLEQCKGVKKSMGDRLDKNTTDELRSALLHAQMFDKDLSTSLEQFKPKLLKVFLLGPPINWLFGVSKACDKVNDANNRLKVLSKQLQN